VQVTPCDIVAFAAHPDDVELTCGGTLALAAEQGWKAGACDFTRGELSTRGTPEVRAREAEEAAKVLGLSCRVNLGLPDGHLRDTDEARQLVVRVIRLMRPRVVIAPQLADHHADHIAVGEIVSRSLYLAGVARYAPGEEPWRPHVLLHYVGGQAVVPSLIVDISSVHEKRMRAIRCHASQFHRPGANEPPTRISHPDFLAAIEATSRRHGFLIGVPFGEAFTTAGPVPVQDLVSLYARKPWEHPRGT
jgi:bacillithiol biosynthesis deacetylase BshB1